MPAEGTEGHAGTQLSSAPGGQRSLSARGRAGKVAQISAHACPIRPAHHRSSMLRTRRWPYGTLTGLHCGLDCTRASYTDIQIGVQRPGEGGLPCLVDGPARSGWIRRPQGRQHVLVFAKPWEGVWQRSVRRCESGGGGWERKGVPGEV
ncbi:hypothetical protein TRAPUB_13811 [Trametes pubescens]|uniref:Uncharacterized protein n=1 Tax=Trametes pubescens TaxID=154538 RepID=A0A1M2VQ70_TRAPU|nr:hypothetical protein TRAPUB_13811 [Trametes pubescens]